MIVSYILLRSEATSGSVASPCDFYRRKRGRPQEYSYAENYQRTDANSGTCAVQVGTDEEGKKILCGHKITSWSTGNLSSHLKTHHVEIWKKCESDKKKLKEDKAWLINSLIPKNVALCGKTVL